MMHLKFLSIFFLDTFKITFHPLDDNCGCWGDMLLESGTKLLDKSIAD